MLKKNNRNPNGIHWTKHIKEKMRQYQLSEKRLIRVLRRPERKELGIAPETIAVMQTAGTKKHPYEIWLMYQIIKSKIPEGVPLPAGPYGAGKNQKSKIKMISAWKYPGKSPAREPPPVPEDILENLEEIILTN